MSPDAEARRAAENRRIMEWRAKNPAKHKLAGVSRAETAARQSAAAAFAAGHSHGCLNCSKPYTCTQACDPSNLKDSLCHGCFGGIQSAPWSK